MSALIDKLGLEVDAAADDKDTSKLLELTGQCQSEFGNANTTERVILRFYEANCYGAIARIKSASSDYRWSWHEDERVSEILALRQAVVEPNFSKLDPIIQCKILTNLGNNLNHLGRPIEAISHWDKSLEIMPGFAMALGNKGKGLIYYGRSLYDYSHTGILTAYANDELNKAISEDVLWDSGPHPEAKEQFTHYHDQSIQILAAIQYDSEFDLDQWPLGQSKAETTYRGWCLHQRLFLSPLNDALRLTAAAQDVIHLPSHTCKIEEKPRFPNYYNLLKQEYVAARYMLYEAINEGNEHISDNDVLLLDGFDGVQFGYRAEQLKTAYRLAYSLFDKIGLFLNDYYSVGMSAGAVKFRTIWGTREKSKFELYACFSESKNWPLRGLYYLSKDLFDENFNDVALPDSQELANLRNRTEHRFLSLQDYPANVQDSVTHAYMTIADFADKTLRIMSMAREALIYLSLAMHREESLRHQNDDDSILSIPIPSVPIERL